jgi:hypothetical protein
MNDRKQAAMSKRLQQMGRGLGSGQETYEKAIEAFNVAVGSAETDLAELGAGAGKEEKAGFQVSSRRARVAPAITLTSFSVSRRPSSRTACSTVDHS